MGFLNGLLGKKSDSTSSKNTAETSYQDFWNWFATKDQVFFDIVKNKNQIETNFFDVMEPKIKGIHQGIYYLTGMKGEDKAELIFTPDGIVKNIAIIEDLVAAAPALPNWIFTALKPASEDISKIGLRMGNYSFDKDNLWFYANTHPNYPDEVAIVLVYENYKAEDKDFIINAAYLFLDNYLGELNSVTTIDDLQLIGKNEANSELIPIEKLKDYLIWREKECIEKYDNVSYNTENDSFSSFEATLYNGLPLIAVVDKTLLDWDNKASHPWMLRINIKYDGQNNNGFPDRSTYEILDRFEDEVDNLLKDADGYLNIGRETADSERIIFIACKDFREPSRVMEQLLKKHNRTVDFSYSLFKDKYWRAVEMFQVN